VQNKREKTPYTDEINEALAFCEEVDTSETAKQAIKTFANGIAKSKVLPRHIELIHKLSGE